MPSAESTVGQEIDGLHDGRHAAPGAHARPDDDERHAHLLLVDRRAVVAPAVLAELLAVVGGDDRRPRPAAASRTRRTIAPMPSSAVAISLS